jgi:DNA-binding transcriptional regulator GbsR (MarR family)
MVFDSIALKRDIGDKLSGIMGELGQNPTLTSIYIELFVSPKPIGLKEIASQTGYSVSTVCNALGLLERLMDVRSFKNPGSKKVFYECQHDMTLIFKKKIGENRRITPQIIGLLKEAEDLLGKSSGEEGQEVAKKIAARRNEFERFMVIMDRLEEILEADAKNAR